MQNYSRSRYGKSGNLPVPDGAQVTQMGYEYYPQGIGNVLRRVSSDFPGELLVTENGIATENDEQRIAFIDAATVPIYLRKKIDYFQKYGIILLVVSPTVKWTAKSVSNSNGVTTQMAM